MAPGLAASIAISGSCMAPFIYPLLGPVYISFHCLLHNLTKTYDKGLAATECGKALKYLLMRFMEVSLF